MAMSICLDSLSSLRFRRAVNCTIAPYIPSYRLTVSFRLLSVCRLLSLPRFRFTCIQFMRSPYVTFPLSSAPFLALGWFCLSSFTYGMFPCFVVLSSSSNRLRSDIDIWLLKIDTPFPKCTANLSSVQQSSIWVRLLLPSFLPSPT